MKLLLRDAWARLFLSGVVIAISIFLASAVGAQVAISEWGVPTANSQPSNLAVDPSGNLWFTETAGNKIGKINQNGVFQEFDVSTANSQPWGVIVEGNGRVWFTETAGNKIGNLNSGVFGQDNVPTVDSEPRGLALDGSGNIWFAETKGNKIGKMTQAGKFDEYNVPTSNSEPWAVVADSSGNVWFTERAGNKIGKLNTSNGQFSEYQVPTSGSAPMGIALDGSGNVWFAEYEGNKIGMMAPSGNFTEHNLPTAGGKPTWVAVDKAETVWYAASGTNSFGRVSGGVVTEYGVPTPGSAPYGIAVDANGNVWFTQQAGNRIGKAVSLAALPTATPTATTVPAATPQPSPTPVPRDVRYFGATGFRIDNDVFWDYFNKRGGVNTFGYPVSRTFQFMGFTTQFFQRAIVQLGPDGGARTMNVLDPGLMPYTKINGSTFPSPDTALSTVAPVPGSVDYDVRVQEFVRTYAPNQFEGLTVNFYQAFVNTVRLEAAFPQGNGNPALLPLLNLELWGVPTSRPQRDPNNSNFVYLRFQRGIMHYDATNGYTQGLLLADYLKSIMTGSGLPSDLDSQALGSQFYRQYNPAKPDWVDRPDQLPGTNLYYAFERQ